MGLFEIFLIGFLVLWVIVLVTLGASGSASSSTPQWRAPEIGVHIPGGSTKSLTSRAWLLYGDD
jgi:hypothetical protein